MKLLIILMGLLCLVTGVEAQCPPEGDVNNDGVVNPVDALLIAQYFVELIDLDTPGFYHSRGDINRDLEVDVLDALMLIRIYLGLEPCPEPKVPANIKPTHPDILYTGRRFINSQSSVTFSLPGVSIKARFEGTSIKGLFRDQQGLNYLNIFIDNNPPLVLRLNRGERAYTLADGLSEGIHEIEITKRTDGYLGEIVFSGFIVNDGNGLLPPEEPPALRFEFIGDSITSGYGNEFSTYEPGGEIFDPRNENNFLAYGAVTARLLNAAYMAVSLTGRGLFRNYEPVEDETIPLVYDRILPVNPDSPKWDFAQWVPDVTVINLGTMDYLSLEYTDDPVDPGEFDNRFKENYKAFINTIRAHYGRDTFIICAIGSMIDDTRLNWISVRKRILEAIEQTVQSFNAAGDDRVYSYFFEPQSPPYGENVHPTVETHRIMAEGLADFIRKILNDS